VREESEEEGDVSLEVWSVDQSPRDKEAAYLDPSNPELDQGSEHLPSCDFVSCSTNGHFDEQAIVMRLKG
jgi:hypothetical protein